MESPEFFRTMNSPYSIRISKHKPDQTGKRMEKAIRLYCTQYKQAWSLQIRGQLGIGLFGVAEGKDDAIANASLSVDDMVALRDAINTALEHSYTNTEQV